MAHKPEDEWERIDDSYEFLFSLYPYDLARVALKDKERLGYYRGVDRASGEIKLTPPNNNNAAKADRPGARSATVMEKRHVGALGAMRPVPKERRVGVANHRGASAGQAEDRR